MASVAAGQTHRVAGALADRRRGGAVALFSPRRSRPLRRATARGCRRWCRGARPTTASSRDDVLDWYARFAEGRPGRDRRRGDRHSRRAERARSCASATTASSRASRGSSRRCSEASGGETRLFIQLIDFLAIRRRPDAREVLRPLPAAQRAHRDALARIAGDERWLTRRTTRCARSSRRSTTTSCPSVLDAARARVARARLSRARHRHRTCRTSASCRRCCPTCSPTPPARASGRRLRRRRAALRARLHDGVVPLGAEHARRRLRRRAREPRAPAARGVRARCARASASGCVVGCRFLARRVSSRAAAASTTRCTSASSSRAPASTSCRSPRAASSRTPSSRKVGEAAYPYTGPSGYECMPTVLSDATGPFGRNVPAASRRSAARCATRASRRRSSPPAASADFEQAEAILAARRRRHRRRRRGSRSPIPTGSRRCAPGAASEIRRCEFTNYCEGARPAAQAGDLQAVGPRWRSTSPTSSGVPTASAA